MASVNSLFVRGLLRWTIVLSTSLIAISCAVPEKLAQKPEDVPLESPRSLWQWHDFSHRSYYGLKGPVQRLVIKAVKVRQANPSEDIPATLSDGWRLRFNRRGRLVSKKRISDDVPYETQYEYAADGETLKRVISYYDGSLWRTSDYHYDRGQLASVSFTDHTNNDRFSVRVRRQVIPRGWFESQLPVEKMDVPIHNKFENGNKLVWSSKGGINNGPAALYFIQTVDGVTSSSVVNEDTVQMAGQGGYRYHYYGNGLLKSVESYSAHDNELYHTTTYQYDDLQLLKSEHKVVTGESVFNEAADASVDYEYQEIDQYGNWLQRTLDYQSAKQQLSLLEKRVITYFQN
ncbi:MAG: hypothetical protein PVG89_12360 [Gammaproteobacteria bacterium]|jgi:hypothetical protein